MEEWKGVRGVDSRRLEAREVDAKGQTCRVTLGRRVSTYSTRNAKEIKKLLAQLL